MSVFTHLSSFHPPPLSSRPHLPAPLCHPPLTVSSSSCHVHHPAQCCKSKWVERGLEWADSSNPTLFRWANTGGGVRKRINKIKGCFWAFPSHIHTSATSQGAFFCFISTHIQNQHHWNSAYFKRHVHQIEQGRPENIEWQKKGGRLDGGYLTKSKSFIVPGMRKLSRWRERSDQTQPCSLSGMKKCWYFGIVLIMI